MKPSSVSHLIPDTAVGGTAINENAHLTSIMILP